MGFERVCQKTKVKVKKIKVNDASSLLQNHEYAQAKFA